MNVDKQLLKLMREDRNRSCCDCDAELADYRNIWANVQIGCFVCVNCKELHEELGMKCKSVNLDKWTEEEVNSVMRLGNRQTIECYERYVPSTWRKPAPDAEPHMIAQWIRAKYVSKYFMVPHYNEKGERSYSNPTSMSHTLPMRLVDYFAVVGVGEIQMDERKPIREDSTISEVIFKPEILDCFPDPNSHLGCPLPDHIGHFIFPLGCHLYNEEKQPTLFHFTLTNTAGIKMYGVTLHVYEELERGQLQVLVEAADKSACSSSPGSKTMWPRWIQNQVDGKVAKGLLVPKALLLLSHYPMYNICTQFLRQLYRISLSEAPVPIERYISNFVCEVPLPPQGQVEVTYALPDRTLTLKRPPPNRLPLVDFSFRPLFACLSIDNIITVFSCLLCEEQVVLCSRHIAVLNPVAESFLSLMFPFVWQGAYIPVMPYGMIDMLEAPVPFLVGISSKYLKDVPKSQRPRSIIFVDLDNDVLDLGFNEEKGVPRTPPKMPDRETSKLRQKLSEFGGMVKVTNTSSNGAKHRLTSRDLEKIDLAFPSGEHLLPINTFATEQGLRLPLQHEHKKGGGWAKTQYKRLNLTKKTPKGHRASFIDLQDVSFLDPANNGNTPDGFSAIEIRAAFLRFFVSTFRNYQAYTSAPTPEDPYHLFNRELFLRESVHLPVSCHEFMTCCITSQMFERFLEERTGNPKQPEIQFFDESILAKLNRSKTNPIKKETPFLSSTSDIHCQTFSPPPPSHWGLPDDGCRYSYSTFPRLDRNLYGTVRWARRLFKTPDQHRNVASTNHQEMLSRSRARRALRKREQSITTTQHELALSRGPEQVDGILLGITKGQAIWRAHQGRREYLSLKTSANVICRMWRRRRVSNEDRSAFRAVIGHAVVIQAAWRGKQGRELAFQWRKSIVSIQAWGRMIALSAHLKRMRAAAIKVQALARGRRCRIAFLVIRQLVILGQACVRGWFMRKVAARDRAEYLMRLRAHIFELWQRAAVPLAYRSKFWTLFQGAGFLDVAVHEDEALRLWRDLALVEKDKEFLTRMKFAQTLRVVEEWLERTQASYAAEVGGSSVAQSSIWKRSSMGGKRPPPPSSWVTGLPISQRTLNALGLGPGPRRASYVNMHFATSGVWGDEAADIQAERQKLKEERETLYSELRREGDEGMRIALFHRFGLEKQKKRKRKLVGLLWQDQDQAMASAEVVLSIFDDLPATHHAWVQTKRDARIRADLLCTVQACINMLQASRYSAALASPREEVLQATHHAARTLDLSKCA